MVIFKNFFKKNCISFPLIISISMILAEIFSAIQLLYINEGIVKGGKGSEMGKEYYRGWRFSLTGMRNV